MSGCSDGTYSELPESDLRRRDSKAKVGLAGHLNKDLAVQYPMYAVNAATKQAVRCHPE